MDVLWEAHDWGGQWGGLHDNYIPVLTRSSRWLRNTVTPTRLIRSQNGAMWGELVTNQR